MPPFARPIAALLPLLLCACAVYQPPTPPHSITISLERTACLGACPVYKVSIDEHGTVTYNGLDHVAATGIHTTTISTYDVGHLVDQARALGFWSMNDKYSAPITDMPTTITTITLDAHTKRVIDYYNAPKSLDKLETLVDQTANITQWISPPRSP